MPKPILVANWKNHPSSLTEAKILLNKLSRSSRLYKKLSLFLAPPLPYLEATALRSKSFANLASQDVSALAKGTHTGMVTPDILKSFGVKLLILGHSEQRALGETNKQVSEKVKLAINAGLIPLVCVGELFRDQDGKHFEFLREQLKLSLVGLNQKSEALKIVVAYEPVWAIGKHADDSINPADLSEMTIFIRKVLTDIFGRTNAERVPILYGGSVESTNAKILFNKTGIRGYLVGHVSLNAESFKAVAQELLSK